MPACLLACLIAYLLALRRFTLLCFASLCVASLCFALRPLLIFTPFALLCLALLRYSALLSFSAT
jgi:hypothetical protein